MKAMTMAMLVAGVSWVIMAPPAMAQDSDTLRTHRLRGVEVYGDRHRRAVKSTSPLQLMDSGEMLRLGVTDIADALHRMPGINLRDYGGAGGLKTVSVRGFGAQHTGVSYDGVLLSECQSGEIDVSRYALDHVQSLRLTVGDNDDIFVSARQAASAAVLAIETLNEVPADCRAHLTAQAKMGSFGYVSPFVRYVQRVADRLTLSATADYTYAENDYPFKLRNGSVVTHERRTNSRMNSGHGEVAAQWQPNDRNRVWGKVYYYDNDRQLPGIVRLYTNVCGERLRDRNLFAQATWQTTSANRQMVMKTTAKYNWAASIYQDTLKVDRKDDATYHQREAYASMALLYAPGGNWSMDYSADYAFNNLSSTLPTDVRPYRHSVLQSLTAKYASRRLVALARLLGSLYYNGARQGASAREMRRLSPSLSLSYRLLPHEALYVRASYKDIFRVPTFCESYFFHYGSTDLSPEKTDQYNIGVTWMHQWSGGGSLQGTVDGYLNHVKDKIVAVPYNMFVWRTVNVAKVTVHGADMSVKGLYPIGRGQRMELSGAYSYQRVANRTNPESEHYGKQIAYAPLHSGSAAIGWLNPWLNMSLHGTGISGRWANNNHYEGTHIGGYWDLGLTAYRIVRLCGSEVELRVDVKNILGKQYEIVANYPMPRTAWMVGVKGRF